MSAGSYESLLKLARLSRTALLWRVRSVCVGPGSNADDENTCVDMQISLGLIPHHRYPERRKETWLV